MPITRPVYRSVQGRFDRDVAQPGAGYPRSVISGRATGSDVALVAAALFSGAAGAAFLVLGERHLGPVAFEPVAQTWTIWAITAAFLSFSVQLNTIGQGGSVAVMFRPAMLGLIAGVTILVGVITFGFRSQLFGSTGLRWPTLALALPVGTAGMGLAKGYWAARRRFIRTGVVLASENAVRLVVCILLVAAGAGAGWFGVAIVIGFVPALFTPWSGIRTRAVSGSSQHMATLGPGLAGLAAFTTLSGAPILLAIAGASDEISTAAFIALTLVRIPHGVAQGLIPRLSVAATSRYETGRDLVSWQRRTAIVVVALSPVAIVAGAVVLGPLTSLLFGAENRLGSTEYVLAALLGLVNLGIIAQSVLLTAERRYRPLVVVWLVSLPFGVAVVWIDATNPVHVLSLLLILQSIAFVLLSALPRPSHDR